MDLLEAADLILTMTQLQKERVMDMEEAKGKEVYNPSFGCGRPITELPTIKKFGSSLGPTEFALLLDKRLREVLDKHYNKVPLFHEW